MLGGKLEAVIEAKIASPETTMKIIDTLRGEFELMLDAKLTSSIQKEMSASSGDLSSGDKSVNVGAINLEGGTLALIIIGIVAVFAVFYLKGKSKVSTATSTTDLLIETINGLKNSNGTKKIVQELAIQRGLEKFLNTRVKKVDNGG